MWSPSQNQAVWDAAYLIVPSSLRGHTFTHRLCKCNNGAMARTLDSSPYLDFDRETWRELRKSMPQVLTETEVEKLRGLGDRIDLDEVADVYLPLSRLLTLYDMSSTQLNAATNSSRRSGGWSAPRASAPPVRPGPIRRSSTQSWSSASPVYFRPCSTRRTPPKPRIPRS